MQSGFGTFTFFRCHVAPITPVVVTLTFTFCHSGSQGCLGGLTVNYTPAQSSWDRISLYVCLKQNTY